VDAFSPAEIEMVTGLANHLGAALEAAALRGRLERAFEELQTARSHLVRSERLRVAGEMASGVAHEFNNVLGAILGRAQLLQRQSQRGEITPLALQRSLRVMERAALDGGETVRRLRQFGSPVDPAASETVDLSSIALEATEVTRTRWENEAQAEDRPIVLEPRLEEGCWVLGRGSELREVFVNLILNAVDAMPRGGTLSISVFRDGDSVRGWVQDSGVGMDEEVRRRIFDPFFTTKGDRGTGLGMSVTYAIIRRHQGEISVFSELGFGTRMEMTFALALAPAAVAEVLPSGEKAHASLRVLVVDDEPSVRDLLADIVRALGHAAESFDSAVTALGRIERGSHDLILSDVGMPGMTGWEFARRVRTLDPDVTIVFVTGWGEEITPEAAEEAGGNLVVPKPFTLEQIAAALALASDRRDRGDLAA
jgi:signal transduction histidine kinase/CheY-like chemotaxis protein